MKEQVKEPMQCSCCDDKKNWLLVIGGAVLVYAIPAMSGLYVSSLDALFGYSSNGVLNVLVAITNGFSCLFVLGGVVMAAFGLVRMWKNKVK